MKSISGPLKKGKGQLILNLFFLVLLFFGLERQGLSMKVGRLPNGLEYIVEKRENSQVVAIQVWVRIGSKNEREDIAGITHFIEHLIFKGTERIGVNVLASKIEGMGGTINAFTSYDITVYHIVIPKEYFREGFELLIESLKEPSFPEAEIEKERRVIEEEIKMGEDDPQRKLFKELFLLSYQGHPYGRPIIGYEETVKKIKREEIVQYFLQHYRPQNMVIVVVGDVKEEDVRTLLEEMFKEEKTFYKKEDQESAQEVLEEKRREKILEKEIKESYLALAYPIPPLNHKDIPALEVVAHILGEGESSRLKEELKIKKGIVTDIASFILPQKEGGLFVIYATFEGKGYKEVKESVEKVIEEIKKGKVEEWELRKAKNRILSSHIYGTERVEGRAREIGYYYAMTGDEGFLERYLKGIEEIKRDEVEKVAKKYLKGEGEKVVVLLPSANPYSFKLNNGLTVLVNRNPSSPSFSFIIAFPGGLKEEEESKNGVFNLLSRMLLKGTKSMDSREISRKIDILAGEISSFAGRNIFGLKGKFLSKDLEEALKLLKEILMEPIFPEKELEILKKEVLSELRQKEDDPFSFTFSSFYRLIYENHPYSKDPLGSPSDIPNITREDIRRYYEKHVGPRYGVLAISGNLEFEKVKRLIEELFSSWEGSGQRLIESSFETTKNKERREEKNLRQVHLIIGFEGIPIKSRERFQAEVLDALLSGMGGRIYRALREEKPYAYAVTFFNRMGFDSGEMGIYVATDPKFLREVLEVIEKEIEKIKTEGFEEEEFQKAKRFLIGNYLINIQSNDAIAYHMCIDTLYGFEPDFFKKFPNFIESVKKEDVERFVRSRLNPEKALKIIVGNLSNP